MASITLKDIPRSVHQALKQRAEQHGRSLNKEALECLQNAVAPAKVSVDALLLEIRAHRASLPGRLNDQLLREAKTAGLP